EYAIVVDMFPSHYVTHDKVQTIPEIGSGPAILMGMNKYHLHESLRRLLPKVKSQYQATFAAIDFAPEAEMIQRNGTTKAFNIFVPMDGWHNVSYSVQISDYIKTKSLIEELIALAKR